MAECGGLEEDNFVVDPGTGFDVVVEIVYFVLDVFVDFNVEKLYLDELFIVFEVVLIDVVDIGDTQATRRSFSTSSANQASFNCSTMAGLVINKVLKNFQ